MQFDFETVRKFLQHEGEFMLAYTNRYIIYLLDIYRFSFFDTWYKYNQ